MSKDVCFNEKAASIVHSVGFDKAKSSFSLQLLLSFNYIQTLQNCKICH